MIKDFKIFENKHDFHINRFTDINVYLQLYLEYLKKNNMIKDFANYNHCAYYLEQNKTATRKTHIPLWIKQIPNFESSYEYCQSYLLPPEADQFYDNNIVLLNDDSIVAVGFLRLKPNERVDYSLTFSSPAPIIKKNIDSIVLDISSASRNNEIINITKNKCIDKSARSLNVPYYYVDEGVQKTKHADIFSIRYNFDIKVVEKTDVLFENIFSTKEYKDLEYKYGFTCISTHKQEINKTIHLVIDLNMLKLKTRNVSNKKYYGIGCVLYLKGNIFTTDIMNDKVFSSMDKVIGTFDATSLQGYREAFKKIDKFFEIYFKKKNIPVLDPIKDKGIINSNRFNL